MKIGDCRLPIFEYRQSAIDNRQWWGPEAHQDEFSTFNREVVGSTPTRPTKNIYDLRLAIAELSPGGNADRNRKLAIGNRQ
jgi:hypothetical protein